LESLFGTKELLWRLAAGTSKNWWAFGVNKVGCVVKRSGPRGRSGRDDIREFFKNGVEARGTTVVKGAGTLQ
jgi:hypothetical protein